ncbi:hypothetical protein [Nocardia cyriacigeorgica]|uniref:hypothetical protein n=1 Tax=Nocardia cyriacigeorgica TaxID=135487 RepID=UPI00030E0387|nr:hypothetical protein [Nocardia cyriacigeorgica]TLF59231.1 hypothetical protein FEK31_08440 [Nocardia cyriacigeorgica]
MIEDIHHETETGRGDFDGVDGRAGKELLWRGESGAVPATEAASGTVARALPSDADVPPTGR